MTSIHEALGRLWEANDHDRIVQYDGRWTSWGAVRALTERIDVELTAAGCGADGRVAVVLTNRMESVAALIAIFRSGRTLVTISPLQPPERLSTDLAAAEVSFVLAPSALWSEDVFTRTVSELGATGWSLDPDGVVVRAEGSGAADGGDPAVAIEMLTSGTTGAPKRIPLNRAQLEASLGAALEHNERPEARPKQALSGAVCLVTLPIVHIGGLWSLLQSLVAARPVAMLDRFTVAGRQRVAVGAGFQAGRLRRRRQNHLRRGTQVGSHHPRALCAAQIRGRQGRPAGLCREASTRLEGTMNMGRVQDKVLLATGGARGQASSHAIKLAEEGADVILFDTCGGIATNEYALATSRDLEKAGLESLDGQAALVVADTNANPNLMHPTGTTAVGEGALR